MFEAPASAPLLSVVIPLLNEAGNAAPLLAEIAVALGGYPPLDGAYEIICVDDGSTDDTAEEISRARAHNARIRLIHHPKRLGMSAAIRNGVRAARAEWVMTIDGDGQNDPADMKRLLDLGWNPIGGEQDRARKILVCGIRVQRQDRWAKKIASRAANAIRRALLNDHCPDTGCSLKLFRRAGYLELPFFNGLHRFMPALFAHYGHEVIFTPVNDRPRRHGISKSDFAGRALKGLADLLGVVWLMARTPKEEAGEY